jgi:hypothetical protein
VIGREAPNPNERTTTMNHPEQNALGRDQHLKRALDRAQRLTEPHPRDHYRPAWWIEATHVGDLTALAAVDLARSERA